MRLPHTMSEDGPAGDRGYRGRVRAGVGRTFHSLRVRDYRLFWCGQVVSATGTWVSNFALTLLVLDLTGSGLAVGVISACQYGPILLVSSWSGVLADRVNRRRLLFVTQALQMAQTSALAVLAFLPDPPLPVLYVVATVGGTLFALDSPSRRAFVTSLVPRAQWANAVSLYMALNTTSQMLGPAVAGILITTVGYGWCFVIDAGTYAVVTILLLFIRPRAGQAEPVAERARGQVMAGFRYLATDPTMRVAFVIMLVAGTISYRWNVSLPLFAQQALRATEGEFTVLFVIFSVGALLAAVVSAGHGVPRLGSIIRLTALLGVALGVLAAVPTLELAYAAAFVVGVVSARAITLITALIQVAAEADMLGRVLATQTVLMMGSTPLTGPPLGYLADEAGGRAPLVVGAVAAFGAALLAWLIHRRDRGRTAPPGVSDA